MVNLGDPSCSERGRGAGGSGGLKGAWRGLGGVGDFIVGLELSAGLPVTIQSADLSPRPHVSLKVMTVGEKLCGK